jgi:Ala-tRNA(Pro) deacylase
MFKNILLRCYRTMHDIYSFLNTHMIKYVRFDHPAVFTCEQAQQLCPSMPGQAIKNLFLYAKSGDRYFLVVVPDGKRVDLKQLKKTLNVSSFSFASEEQLHAYLGVEPGSVTILGIINDTNHKVTVLFDASLYGKELQCHPLVNTATLVIPFADIERFLHLTGHQYQSVDIPGK